jgi:hypothetical protein
MASSLSKLSISSLSTGFSSNSISTMVEPLETPTSPASPPTGVSQLSGLMSPFSPFSPLSSLPQPEMTEEEIKALRLRFNRFAEGSGKAGVLFYPEFVKMFCELYKIQRPESSAKWINSVWKEIDVENCGSVNFEAFCDWYVAYFEPFTGQLCGDRLPGMAAAAA